MGRKRNRNSQRNKLRKEPAPLENIERLTCAYPVPFVRELPAGQRLKNSYTNYEEKLVKQIGGLRKNIFGLQYSNNIPYEDEFKEENKRINRKNYEEINYEDFDD